MTAEDVSRQARQYITERVLDILMERAKAGDIKALELLIDRIMPVARKGNHQRY